MKKTAEDLQHTIFLALPLLKDITEEAASGKPASGKWSVKEIIGHLIDSAGNNQQKFVRTAAEDGLQFPGYAQDHWVACQHYNEADWAGLVDLWMALNKHIAHVMLHLAEPVLDHKVFIDDKGPFSLRFLMTDYVDHLKHHLKVILPDAPFLDNDFRMIY